MAIKYSNELRRVNRMIKRLEANGYEVAIGIEGLTTRQLHNIKSGRDLVRRGLYKFSEAGYEALRSKQENRRAKEREKRAVRKAVKTQAPVTRYTESESGAYNSSGESIARINVFTGSEATIQLDMLLGIAEYGRTYTGRKTDKSAVKSVQDSGKRLIDIINRARTMHSDEEIVARIESDYGSIREFARHIERLVLAVYDREYAEWSGGLVAYNIEIDDICDTLYCLGA